jgi:hypothetical protein
MARLYCVRALGSLERGRVRSRVAWTLERGGVRSREREPSSEADFARGGHEPSSEADLARGGALLGCSSGPRGPSRRGLCCVHTFRGVFVFCAFLQVLSRTPPVFRGPSGLSPTEGGRRVGFGRGEFAGHSFARGQYEYGGNDRSFRSQRSYGPRSPLRGTRGPPRGRVSVPPRRDRMDFANPIFEQMARHWLDSFCTNPSAESFGHSRSRFLFCRWEAWRVFG